MKICRYSVDGHHPAWGVIDDNHVRRVVGGDFPDLVPGDAAHDLGSVRLEAPCKPSKIVGVGRNYWSLLQQQNVTPNSEPLLFLKAPNSLSGHDSSVCVPQNVNELIFEGELAVVVGKESSHLFAHEVASHIAGYTCANDFTVRDWMSEPVQWALAKSCDGLCALGPWIETDLVSPSDVRIRTFVNDVLMQDASSADMVVDIDSLMVFITRYLTLLPGDVVLTGTPAGVATTSPGDVIDVTIDGVGTLRSRVASPFRRTAANES